MFTVVELLFDSVFLHLPKGPLPTTLAEAVQPATEGGPTEIAPSETTAANQQPGGGTTAVVPTTGGSSDSREEGEEVENT